MLRSGVTEDFILLCSMETSLLSFYLSADLSGDPGNLVQSFVFLGGVKCGKMVENYFSEKDVLITGIKLERKRTYYIVHYSLNSF